VLNSARIGAGCLIGAGALINEGKVNPDGLLVTGALDNGVQSPEDAARARLLPSVGLRRNNAARFRAGLRVL